MPSVSLNEYKKIRTRLPLSHGAYDTGRSTTEHIHTFKLLAEKAIASENYEITLLMLDMSKAFGTVERCNLIKILLGEDEIYLTKFF